jgi:hypothetical protein
MRTVVTVLWVVRLWFLVRISTFAIAGGERA